jgi:glyoxylase-like metal-dependent hydrolase (beta-lactamase superfamily II)
MGKGTFALLTEINLGAARNVLAIAIGGASLAACAAPPSRSTPEPLPTETAPALATATTVAAKATTHTTVPTLAPEPTASPAPAEATPAATATSIAMLPPASYLPVNLGFVNAYVLVRGNEVAIVDTGVANSADKINAVMKSASRDWPDVQHVILTHYHPDHVGSMNEVMAASAKATAYAGAEDIPQIKTSVPIRAVADGAEVFGLQIIATPGHTPGHVSVFDPAGSVLILGDAMTNNNQLSGSPPQFTTDMAMANESVRKLAQLKFETAYFGHGSPLEKGASEAIAKLAATLK